MPEPRRCSQEGCTAAAEWRVFWPGEAPLLACTPHKMHALNLGTAMGVAIHAELLPLDPAALVWTSEMGEISGMGGSYERGLQAMVRAGLAWWDAHPDADPRFKGYENVMGVLLEDNADAKALTQAMMDARTTMDDGREVRCGDEATGAMHRWGVNHIFAIRRLGWSDYVRQMTGRPREQEGA